MKEPNEVISWACNLTDSIIAGEYNIPKEMTYCINNLQDAVHSYLNENGKNLSDSLTKDYVEYKKKQVASRLQYLERMMKGPHI